MTLIITLKKGSPVTLKGVTSVMSPPVNDFSGEDIRNMCFPSDKDITIRHSGGTYFIPKNTYETISITD